MEIKTRRDVMADTHMLQIRSCAPRARARPIEPLGTIVTSPRKSGDWESLHNLRFHCEMESN